MPTAPDLPAIESLGFEELMALRTAIDTRLDQIRANFIDQAAALGLAVVVGNGKKRKRRPNAHKDTD